MAIQDNAFFEGALAGMNPQLHITARWLRDWIWKAYPEANELLYLKEKYFAVGWGFTDKQTEIFVTFAVYGKYINLGFNFGNAVPDPKGLLQGSGNLYRYIRIENLETFPAADVMELMQASWVYTHNRLKPKAKIIQGQTILKQDTRAKS